MKKIILTGTALVAFAAASFAQVGPANQNSNSVTVNQVGDAQTATPTQSGSKQKATINQNEGNAQNYGNLAITNQTGSVVNTATINQNEGSSANRAGITQGDGQHTATISQSNNSGGGNVVADNDPNTQDGDGNWAGVEQRGLKNKSSLQQDNNSRRNFVETYQNGTGTGNTATVKQNDNSESNKARVYQGDGNNAVQGNNATINQNGGAMGVSARNTATVDQDGSSQTGNIDQNNLSSDNTATVNQTGGTGEAMIKQIDNSYWNQATVYQSAGDHTALIEQSGNSHHNVATVNQSGAGTDDAKIMQVYETANNTAAINQNGTTGINTAKITQQSAYNDGHGGNQATINQSNGSGNVAEVIQGKALEPIAGDIASGNVATLNQNGSTNTAKLKQEGDLHEATINQNGIGNVVKGLGADTFATQLGLDNTLNVTQNGGTGVNNANVAEAYQNGTGNTATINQTYQP